MGNKAIVIACFAGLLAAVYLFCMRSTPRKGAMRVVERLFMGMILCYLCQLLLAPLGLTLPQGPVPALFAGYLGLPGAALAAWLHLAP